MPMPTAGPPTAATTGGEAVRRAVQEHRARLRVGVRRGERGSEHGVHLDRDRVFLVDAVEAYTGNTRPSRGPRQLTSDQGGSP